MTYTTVHKTYAADTFAAAVAEMMLDPDIWGRYGLDVGEIPSERGSVLALASGEGRGEQIGYCVESWEWKNHELTVHFR